MQACDYIVDLAADDHYVGSLFYLCNLEAETNHRAQSFNSEAIQESASRVQATLLVVAEIACTLNMVPEFENYLEKNEGMKLEGFWADSIGPALRRLR